MEQFKPTFGIEPTNKYVKTKTELMQAMNSVRELTPQEQQILATELFGAANVSAAIT